MEMGMGMGMGMYIAESVMGCRLVCMQNGCSGCSGVIMQGGMSAVLLHFHCIIVLLTMAVGKYCTL